MEDPCESARSCSIIISSAIGFSCIMLNLFVEKRWVLVVGIILFAVPCLPWALILLLGWFLVFLDRAIAWACGSFFCGSCCSKAGDHQGGSTSTGEGPNDFAVEIV